MAAARQAQMDRDALDDIATRFIKCMALEDKQNRERLGFTMEKAHWYYIDFFVQNKQCTHLRFDDFVKRILLFVPEIQPVVGDIPSFVKYFHKYKKTVPVHGAVLLSDDMRQILLVQNMGGLCFSYPKGKLNSLETAFECALREALEETGFNALHLAHEEDSVPFGGEDGRLFLVRGVPTDFAFEPRVRYEIQAIQWFHTDPKELGGMGFNLPNIKLVLAWIDRQRANDVKTGRKVISSTASQAGIWVHHDDDPLHAAGPIPAAAQLYTSAQQPLPVVGAGPVVVPGAKAKEKRESKRASLQPWTAEGPSPVAAARPVASAAKHGARPAPAKDRARQGHESRAPGGRFKFDMEAVLRRFDSIVADRPS